MYTLTDLILVSAIVGLVFFILGVIFHLWLCASHGQDKELERKRKANFPEVLPPVDDDEHAKARMRGGKSL